MSTNATRMPAIFFGHGSPMNALEDNRYTDAWAQLGASVARLQPKAILSVSAHWYTRGTGVTAMTQPKTIHDFGGFPQALFDVRYPAPGDPQLAAQVRDLLAPVAVAMDQSWGLDHGTWSVLVKAFPKADVPVIQLSIDATQPAQFHFDLGRKLAVLREQGVLIIGSGDVVHNLRLMSRGQDVPVPGWAQRFNDHIRESLVSGDIQSVIDYADQGQDAQLSVPTPEHYLPLLYVAGAKQDDETISIAVDGIDIGSISMLTAVVGAV
ncbi:Aromatic ring-opening dioxygenase, catalytic subunit, LigB family [Collimonas sp. OK607]|uniref:4,5-DOPA-extradiol-dioxygenase n=1 Tax=Collimonas sp. OK607 TaxID=1798194 RepID=UPI0008ED087C|nr:4,5-DOPA dioxygenase extradiol [Collimonas sp. OK607]SFA88017.1 Aromatic ring-opening dioxygenase, catalytic subunit, LigB family [Collimonas sp. OK607]